MSGFSADWLALRAGVDARARDGGLGRLLGDYFAGWGAVRVLDLGAGSGANLRATAPLIGARQHWVLADDDAELLSRAEAVPGATVERRRVDLGRELATLFEPAPDLVTASAFFDLCGAGWIGGLVDVVAACGAAVYAVLTYDGREDWAPGHPLDEEVLAAFHADQRRDKGLGPALGPDAYAVLAAGLMTRGYTVQEATSDWVLTQPGDMALIAALAEGSADAVAGALGAETADRWREAREGAARVVIGHRDLLALPPG